MFLLVSLSKSKFFTRVAPVSFVYHSCRTGVVSVALVSNLCGTGVARVSLVSLVSYSFCIRVVRVWHWCCKLNEIELASICYNTGNDEITIYFCNDLYKFINLGSFRVKLFKLLRTCLNCLSFV